MASLRKRLSKWALGSDDEQANRPIGMDVHRGSIDSGYYSMTHKRESQISGLLPRDDSPNSSPGHLHKALATTFGFLADTVRQGVTSLHQKSPRKDDDLSEQSEFETPEQTPKKHNRRPSLFSSVRSRKNVFKPRSPEAVFNSPDSPERPSTPSRVSNENAPILDVPIPNSCLNNASPKRITGLPATGGTVLWPSPTKVAVGTDNPCIDRDDLSIRVRQFVASALAAPTSRKSSAPHQDDKGYVAEVESGAEQSESELSIPSGEQNAASGLSEISLCPPNSHGKATTRVRDDDPSGSPVKVVSLPQVSPTIGPSQAYRVELDPIVPKASQNGSRVPSDVYEADAELSESSPEVTPNMGSRAAWERTRADRDRRYLETMRDGTQSGGDPPLQLPPPKSSSRSLVYNEIDSVPELEAIGERIPGESSPTGALKYAVEASERRCGADLSEEDPPISALSYAVEAAERQSGTNLWEEEDNNLSVPFEGRLPPSILSASITPDDIMALEGANDRFVNDNILSWSDFETDISDNYPSQQTALPQPEDPFEAGLRAAGLSIQSYTRQTSVAIPEILGQSLPNQNPPVRSPTPVSHYRSVSDLSEVTNDSCAVTTNSPSCEAPPPFPSLHVRSEPARRMSSNMAALNVSEKVEIPLVGPANTGLKHSSRSCLPSEVTDLATRHNDAASPLPAQVEPDPSTTELIDENTGQLKLEAEFHTSQKPFNAAKLPNFELPSPPRRSPKSRCSPNGKRSLRGKKNARGRPRVPFSETTGNATKEEPSPRVGTPQFSVKHFKPTSEESSPYAGFELEPVSFEAPVAQGKAGSSPLASDKKAVWFAKDVEIIGHADEDSQDPLVPVATSLRETKTLSEKGLGKELEEKQELALSRLKKKLESSDQGQSLSDKENFDADAVPKTDKPRWRVPSKIPDSLT